MRIIQEDTIKYHLYDNGTHEINVLTREQYFYDSEEERNEHKKEMLQKGFASSEQVRKNIGSVMNPEFVWFGDYHKYERI